MLRTNTFARLVPLWRDTQRTLHHFDTAGVLAFAREENLEKLHEGHPEADGDMIKAEALRTRLRHSILAQHSPGGQC